MRRETVDPVASVAESPLDIRMENNSSSRVSPIDTPKVTTREDTGAAAVLVFKVVSTPQPHEPCLKTHERIVAFQC
jgi:hypothetical protein